MISRVFMKKTIHFLTILIIYAVTCVPLFGNTLRKSSKIVKVNGTVITYGQLKKKVDEANKLATLTGKKYTEKEMLQSMINDQLLYNVLKNEKMLVSEKDIKETLEAEKNKFTRVMMLENESYQFKQADFEKYIQDTGKISYDDYIDRMKFKASIQKYIFTLAESKLEQIDNRVYSEELLIKVRHQILLAYTTPEHILLKHVFAKDRKTIDKAYKDLEGGKTFEVVCKRYSEDQDSVNKKDPVTGRLERGYLGRVPHTKEGFDVLKRELKIDDSAIRKIFKLEEKKYSAVIESPFGFHIFFIKERVEENVPQYEDMKDELIQYVRMAEKDTLLKNTYEALLKKIRDEADIKYYEEDFK